VGIESTAFRILIVMKQFIRLDGVIWTRHMIAESIREDVKDVRLALGFLERRGFVSSVKSDYNGEICVEYDITSEGKQAVDDARTNPKISSNESEWIRRARSGFNTARNQSSLSRVAIPTSNGVEREDEMSIEDYLDKLRSQEEWPGWTGWKGSRPRPIK